MWSHSYDRFRLEREAGLARADPKGVVNHEWGPCKMTTTRRWRRIPVVLSLAVIGPGLFVNPAFAGWPIHKQQVVYATPVVPAQAPMVYAAQAPVAYTAQAPVAYTAQAPVAYTAQAPVAYYSQAPAPYAAQAPATYMMPTAAAPAGSAMTGAAPTTASAPTEQGIRISQTVRNALFADLVAYYHSEDSGTTRVEKIRAVRERAREEFEALLEGEDNPELNGGERQDLNTLVDWVISGGQTTGQRTYYPPLAPPGPVAGAPVAGAPGAGYAHPGMVAQPVLFVPVTLKPVYPHYHNKLFHKP
jgi:hypothetical protein